VSFNSIDRHSRRYQSRTMQSCDTRKRQMIFVNKYSESIQKVLSMRVCVILWCSRPIRHSEKRLSSLSQFSDDDDFPKILIRYSLSFPKLEARTNADLTCKTNNIIFMTDSEINVKPERTALVRFHSSSVHFAFCFLWNCCPDVLASHYSSDSRPRSWGKQNTGSRRTANLDQAYV